MTKWTLLGGFYAILDPNHCNGRDPLWVTDQLLAGGCAVLQLRDKSLPDDELAELAKRVRERCARSGTPFVMNDRADIALLVAADGLHLGQDDLSVSAARTVVRDMPIGISTHTLDQATRAANEGANLIGFGPVFDTESKQHPDPTVGLDTLAQLCSTVSIPVVAIGGITQDTASDAKTAGATFIAAIGAVIGAPDIQQAAVAMSNASRAPA